MQWAIWLHFIDLMMNVGRNRACNSTYIKIKITIYVIILSLYFIYKYFNKVILLVILKNMFYYNIIILYR